MTGEEGRAGAAAPPWNRERGKIHVVLPAYNEEGNLGRLLERIDQSMAEDGASFEVIVVDDGSGDRTPEIAREYARYMPVHLERHAANQGLGAAIRDGLRIAAGRCADRDIVVVMDADNSHTPGLIRSMTRLVQEGNDVVIASRYQKGANVRGLALHRRLLSFGARVLFRLTFPIRGVRDYTCGYRAYRGAVLKEALRRYGSRFITEEGFQCTVEILLKLRSMDVIMREAPLILRYDLKSGASKMNVPRTLFHTLALIGRRRIGF